MSTRDLSGALRMEKLRRPPLGHYSSLEQTADDGVDEPVADEFGASGAGKQSGPRRLMLRALFSGLVCIFVAGLYLSYAFTSGAPSTSTAGVSVDAATGGPSSSHADDSFVLHPEDHVYRKAKTIHLKWNVTKAVLAPDGVSKSVYLINGQFPGPLVEARSGDELVVEVHNALDIDGAEGVSVHWHGLLMKGANEMDGVVGLTQCAIRPSQSFTYRFRIDESQHGTYWYHAHAGVQRADGLFGGLVIHKPAKPGGLEPELIRHEYEAEQLLLVGDWYHKPAKDVLEWFVDPNHYAYEPSPDSMLINGHGSFNCSNANKANPVNCTLIERPALKLAASKRLRLRIVNTGITTGVTLSLTNAAFRLIAVDGGYPVSSNTSAASSVGILYPGERMDVVIDRTAPEANAAGVASLPGQSEMQVVLDRENMGLTNFALSRKQAFPLVWQGSKDSAPFISTSLGQGDVSPHVALNEVAGALLDASFSGIQQPAEKAVLYTTMLVRAANHNRPVGTVNHTSWAVGDADGSPLLALSRDHWASAIPQPTKAQSLKVPWFRESGAERWIELVVNNFDEKGHPFHMHGYSFFVVATGRPAVGQGLGYNPLDPGTQAPAVNAANPLRKDTVYVPSTGYVILRFPLDNDGLWLLHCHVLWHQSVGMGIVLQIGDIPARARQAASALCLR
ncbi:hypothetical protein HIM_05825 [Hirsutella minnesotensis 3608]|uniref:Uncharacterized protein n=1 Tax=Hirsutella minnesotensis 3608 TaxID=1043627 RepID=A0A0F7ZUE2_9HYPO|nr:hypothetical protein HIM_05825 [Hirsutella minnesotensis 3608]